MTLNLWEVARKSGSLYHLHSEAWPRLPKQGCAVDSFRKTDRAPRAGQPLLGTGMRANRIQQSICSSGDRQHRQLSKDRVWWHTLPRASAWIQKAVAGGSGVAIISLEETHPCPHRPLCRLLTLLGGGGLPTEAQWTVDSVHQQQAWTSLG